MNRKQEDSVTIDWEKKQHRIRPMSQLEGLRENVIGIQEDEELPVSCRVEGNHEIPMPSSKLELVQTITIKSIFQGERQLVDPILLQKVYSLDSLISKNSKLEFQ